MARLLVVLLVLGAGGWWAYSEFISPAQREAATLPAATPQSTAAVATQLANAQRALAQSQQSGKAVAVTLTFTDADLTAAAASANLSQSGVAIRDESVHVLTASLLLTGTAQVGPISGPVRVSAVPSVTNGRAVVTVDQATISGVNMPDNVRASVQASIQAALDGLVPARLRIDKVTAAQGVLTIHATALP